MTPTAIHGITAEKVRQAATDAALSATFENMRPGVCDASMIRQAEFDTLRSLAPNATLLASLNAHAAYNQGQDNAFYQDFRRRLMEADGRSAIFWKGETDDYIYGPDAATDPAMGPELRPSLATAEALADACNRLMEFTTPVTFRRWDGIYLDDAWRNGYPFRYASFASMYGPHAISGFRSHVQHFIECMKTYGCKVWTNSASAEGFANAANCAEARSRVKWGDLALAAAKSREVQWVAWGYAEPGTDWLLKGEIL